MYVLYRKLHLITYPAYRKPLKLGCWLQFQ